MISTKRLAGLVAAGGLALATLGTASATASASVRSHPIIGAKVAAVRPGGPMIRPGGAGLRAASAGVGVPTISENWSGYAALQPGKKFTYVHSEWIQPAVKCTGTPLQYTSNWVGLDGFNDGTVEQDGTFGHCGGPDSKTPIYSAWYEMFPAGSVNVFPVKPGDVIEASVRYMASTHMFDLTISDVSTGKASGTSAACGACQRSSAEWIIERPAGCSSPSDCFLFALADFHNVTMTDDTAKAGSGAQSLDSFATVYPIYMVSPLNSGGFISLDTTGAVDSGTDGFTETWNRSGKPIPITFSTKH